MKLCSSVSASVDSSLDVISTDFLFAVMSLSFSVRASFLCSEKSSTLVMVIGSSVIYLLKKIEGWFCGAVTFVILTLR